MIELYAGGVRVHVHPLAALLPLLGLALGLRTEVPALLLSLFAHEAGHLLFARLARVRVEAMTATPFGCGIQLGNLYALSPWQTFAVAVGGPLASLQLILIDAALARWGALSPAFALSLLRVTLALLLFNLLPALPLDGGRMLYALTSRWLGRERACRLAARLGYVVVLALLAGTAYLFIGTHRFNLALPACAAFMLAGIAEDRRALCDVIHSSLLNALKPTGAPIPMRLCAVCDDYPILKALRYAAPDAATLFAVYRTGVLSALIDERALLDLALEQPGATVAAALKNRSRII